MDGCLFGIDRYNVQTSYNVHVVVEVTAKGIALFIGNSTLTILFLLLP